MSKKFYTALNQFQTWPKLGATPASSLTYDDVILFPQNSRVSSRAEIDTSIKLGPYQLRLPVVVAPMDTIIGEKMIRIVAKAGGIGTLPRNSVEHSLEICQRLTQDKIPCIYAIGLKNALETAAKFKKAGAKFVLIDIAHGGINRIITAAKQIKQQLKLDVMAGNIASYSLALAYKQAKIDVARVGVGPGGLCTTRLVAGSGFPQLSAVFETSSAKIPVVADGGIRHPGDVAKAIAAGATAVMIGSMLAGTEETPGEIIGNRKYVRGQASSDYMRDNKIETGEYRAAEGIATTVPMKGSAMVVFQQIAGGLRSAMSYTGATNIRNFQKKAVFALVSTAAAREARPHILE